MERIIQQSQRFASVESCNVHQTCARWTGKVLPLSLGTWLATANGGVMASLTKNIVVDDVTRVTRQQFRNGRWSTACLAARIADPTLSSAGVCIVQRVFQDFVEGIKTSDDADSLRSATSTALAALDFHRFAYFVLSKPSISAGELISTYPQAWLDRYAEQKYEWIDPVITGVRTRDKPFEWSKAPANPSPGQCQLFDEAAQFGIRCGFAIPLREPGRPVAAVAIVSDESAITFRRHLQVNRRVLTLMAVFVHLHARRILGVERVVAGIRLSHREFECLHWAARGKSAWEIGRILGIARRTASFHLDNAKAKLGVRSICQAVARLSAEG